MERRRIGLVSKGAPARQHSDILTEDGEKVHGSRVAFCCRYISVQMRMSSIPAPWSSRTA